jgi:monoamine oxidase
LKWGFTFTFPDQKHSTLGLRCAPRKLFTFPIQYQLVKRRRALKKIGVGLSAGMFLPSLLTSCAKDDPGPEVPFDGNVIVIGAGAAGLYAADILRIKGVKVTVLEAAGQPGGRIRSLRNQEDVQYQTFSNTSQADFPVELGAEVIYGSDSSWGKIISDLRISTVELDAAAPRYILDNQAKTSAGWQGDGDFGTVQNFVNNLANFSGGGSIKDAAAVSARAQALLNSQAGNFYGSASEQIGASGIAESLKLVKHDKKQLVTKANPWQDVLLSRFSEMLPGVQYNTVVTRIDWGSDVITITDKTGKIYSAKKVIVTVPLSILKSGDITFNPPLPNSTVGAIGKFGMDQAVRILLDFKKNFWGTDTSFIWGGSTAPQYFSAGVGRSNLYRTMSITIYGQKAQQLSLLSDLEKVKLVLKELDLIYAGQGTQFIRRDLDKPDPVPPQDPYSNILFLVQDWSKTEFAKGGFSYPLVGTTLQHRKDMAAPISDILYFAGEATDFSGDAGTVSGALNSAVRVVEEVVKSILG